MSLKARFANFVANIRPTEAHLTEARRQVDYMVEALHDVVTADGSFTLIKVLRAGSNAKHTSLMRTSENVFDVDLPPVVSCRYLSSQRNLRSRARLLGSLYHLFFLTS